MRQSWSSCWVSILYPSLIIVIFVIDKLVVVVCAEDLGVEPTKERIEEAFEVSDVQLS